jgi:hypothetical protein
VWGLPYGIYAESPLKLLQNSPEVYHTYFSILRVCLSLPLFIRSFSSCAFQDWAVCIFVSQVVNHLGCIGLIA